ncbi:MAG: hypothetical protein CMD18_00985 [Flavobacteriales bacterium]|nr:hypothetical protein [Flavobacteriales bacterium]
MHQQYIRVIFAINFLELKKFFRKILKFIYWFSGAMVVLGLFITKISPNSFSLAPFIAYSTPAWLLLNMLYLFLVFYKKKYWLISGGFLLIGLFGLKDTYALNFFQKNGEIRVMSYNVRLFDVYNWIQREEWSDWEERKDNGLILDSIFKSIRFENPDVICFQEFFNQPIGNYKTKKEFKRKQGYKYVNDAYSFKEKGSHYGMATFSKVPILYKEFIPFTNTKNNGILISDLKKGEDTLRVINVHLQSFKFGREHYKYIRGLKDSTVETINMRKTKDLISRLNSGFKKRSEQLELVEKQIEKSPYPVILCADLNEIPLSYVYKKLTKHLSDAFLDSGNGLGVTHTSGYPFMRIDYIMTSPELESKSFHLIHKELSDHYPVVSEISIKGSI